MAWRVVWSIIPGVLLSFGVFITNIAKKYMQTFYSLQTGKGMAQEIFKNSENEASKSNILGYTKHYWVGIEDELKQWVQENWRRWQEEKPEWLDDVTRSRIPVEWIPIAVDRKKESARRSMRKPSLLNSIRIVPDEEDN